MIPLLPSMLIKAAKALPTEPEKKKPRGRDWTLIMLIAPLFIVMGAIVLSPFVWLIGDMGGLQGLGIVALSLLGLWLFLVIFCLFWDICKEFIGLIRTP